MTEKAVTIAITVVVPADLIEEDIEYQVRNSLLDRISENGLDNWELSAVTIVNAMAL